MGLLERLVTMLRGADTRPSEPGPGAVHISESYLREARQTAPALSDLLTRVAARIEPGVTTREINDQIDSALRAAHLQPAMKGYRGYPMSATVSINDELLHAVPSGRRVSAGDLVKLQTAGLAKQGFVAQGWTFAIGEISADGQRLLAAAGQSLRAARAAIRAGARIGDVSAAIQAAVESQGLVVIREFVGSGIGRMLHQAPPIPCHGQPGTGRRLLEGEVLHVQVILKEGTPALTIADDGWTAVAADGRRGAIVSCMMEVEATGCRLLGRLLDA